MHVKPFSGCANVCGKQVFSQTHYHKQTGGHRFKSLLWFEYFYTFQKRNADGLVYVIHSFILHLRRSTCIKLYTQPGNYTRLVNMLYSQLAPTPNIWPLSSCSKINKVESKNAIIFIQLQQFVDSQTISLILSISGM